MCVLKHQHPGFTLKSTTGKPLFRLLPIRISQIRRTEGVTRARLALEHWRFLRLVFQIMSPNFVDVTKTQFKDAKHGNCIDRETDSPSLPSRKFPEAVAAALKGRETPEMFFFFFLNSHLVTV